MESHERRKLMVLKPMKLLYRVWFEKIVSPTGISSSSSFECRRTPMTSEFTVVLTLSMWRQLSCYLGGEGVCVVGGWRGKVALCNCGFVSLQDTVGRLERPLLFRLVLHREGHGFHIGRQSISICGQ